MSFILDALKKSENDRQRQSGPALFETRVVPRRARFPVWAIALGALLIVNLVVIAWVLLRRPAVAKETPEETQSAASPAPAVAAAAAAPPAPPPQSQAYTPPPPQGSPPQAYPQGPQGYQQAPQGYPPQSAYPPNMQGYPQGAPPQYAQGQPGMAQPQQQYGAPQGAPPAYSQNLPSLTEEGAPTTNINPEDYAPATEARPGPFENHVRRGTESGLLTYEEAATKVSIPPVRLDLHVYAPDPAKRFVLVNMRRMREGESTPEGVKVDAITTDGAILSFRGMQFVLERE